MSQIFEFLLLFLRQFGGGPGPPENNLVRFGLAAVPWGALLVIAWSRQRSQELPRERLLVWGFGLGLARELYMFAQMSGRVIGVSEGGLAHILHQPLEHALAMASVIVVAGAFLRYILDDALLSRRYLQVGLGVTVLCSVIGFWLWPRHLAAFPEVQFHETWGAWLFHAPLPVFIGVAVVFLGRKRLWLRNVVTVALMFFFLGEFLFLLNYATNRDYGHIICPTGNTFHILAIPILGYVYLREQSMEKAEAEQALETYRGHLEDLVDERTVELTAVNTRLAAQNAVAGTLSQSLDLDRILHTALDMVLAVLDLQVGSVFLLGLDEQRLVQQIHHGQVPMDELAAEQSAWYKISAQAVATMQGIVFPAFDAYDERNSACDVNAELGTLVSTPLVAKGRAVGALTLGAGRTDAIQQSGLDLLTAIGQQIGMAIENARLYQQAERWAEELTLLHQVSTFLTSTLDAQRIYNQMAEQSTSFWAARWPASFCGMSSVRGPRSSLAMV